MDDMNAGGAPDAIPGSRERPLRLEGGEELDIREGRYATGGRALLLVDRQTREPYAHLTVNVPGASLGPDEVLVRTWSPGAEQAVEAARSDSRFTDTGRRVQVSDFVEAEVWTYRPEQSPAAPAPAEPWRGTAAEAVREAARRHDVQAFTTPDWQERGRLRPEGPRELAELLEATGRGVDRDGRVYTVREDGKVENTVTGRVEYVPVTPEIVAAQLVKETPAVRREATRRGADEPSADAGRERSDDTGPGISFT